MREAVDQKDLEKITGGAGQTAEKGQKEQLMRIACPKCGDIFKANVQKSSVNCPSCGKKIEIKG